MRHSKAATAVLRDFPRIFFACHRRHVLDPGIGKLVTEKQGEILDHLDPVHPVSLSSLAAHMGVTLGTMSVSVERLVRRGYIARSPDPLDRRGILLVLTDSGARVCGSRSVLDAELVDRLLGALSADERKQAMGGLGLLARAAEKLAVDRQMHRRRIR